MELFESLIPLKINWFGDATISIGRDADLLRLAQKSGCKILLIGFESLNADTLQSIGKKVNKIEDYSLSINNIHEAGVSIIGSFILGWDQDDTTAFDKVYGFINDNKIEIPNINVLIPFPGTPIYEQMKKEGRLLHEQWELFSTTAGNVVFRPKLMTIEQLRHGYLKTQSKVFSLKSIIRRLSKCTDPVIFLVCLQANLRKMQSIHQKIADQTVQ